MTRDIELLVEASRAASNATTLANFVGIFACATALLVGALVVIGIVAYMLRVWHADATPSGNCPCCGRPYEAKGETSPPRIDCT